MELTLSARRLLSGNEAVARGAYEAGVRLATGYPGTPSTEILETIGRIGAIEAQWSPNEKVALEVGMGAAFCGARVLVTMKHVGLNVAADPFFTLAYTGVKGGLVIVSADDPGMHSSQNEQDNRHYARFAKVPMLEPSDSQEAKDFTLQAFELSERFDTPVLLRMTTRVCHGKSIVEEGPLPKTSTECRFERNPKKFVMIPAYAKKRHEEVEKRMAELSRYSDTFEGNRIEPGHPSIGIVTSGICYAYAREVMPEASFLKLGMTYPLPVKTIRKFATQVKRLVVLEELDPFLEDQIRALGIEVEPRDSSLLLGELNPDRVRKILTGVEPPEIPAFKPRPPVLCAGCPHRAIFTVLKKKGCIVTGDIGCYTLGVLQPMGGMDTCVCMGASVGQCLGFGKVLPEKDRKKVVAVIGDSTFLHSGVTGLMDMVYNRGRGTVLILDNRITAMTGGQQNPGTGKDLYGQEAPELDLPALCRALGVQDVRVTNPWDLEDLEKNLLEAMEYNGPSVIINRGACALLDRQPVVPKKIDEEICKVCGLCVKTGCPAIRQVDGRVEIDPLQCRSCGVCVEICPFDAIRDGDSEKD